MAQCSPKAKANYKEYKTCFSKDALVKLATTWNSLNQANKIPNVSRASIKELWAAIKVRMVQTCGEGATSDTTAMEACWVDKLPNIGPSGQSGQEALLSHFTPKKPSSWKKNPRQWLTNIDIDNVLQQYDEDTTNHYKYMGAFPIDFAKPVSAFGTCLYNEMCTIDMKRLLAQKKSIVGAVFNTDPSDMPGQHWISIIVVINPALPSFGVYFQDSAGGPPPTEVVKFMESMKQQAATLSSKPFRVDVNKKRQQYKNTECGVYSIAYHIRWINLLKKNPDTRFEDVAIVIDDDNLAKARDLLFRSAF
jgi:hypothetical protein